MIKYYKYFALFFLPFVLLVILGLQPLVNLYMLLVGIINIVVFPFFNIFLFVLLFPTNGLISTEYNLFGYLHVSYISYLFALISGLILYKKKQPHHRQFPYIKKLNEIQRISCYFFIFLFCYMFLGDLKEYSQNIIHLDLLVTRTIRGFMFLAASILFVKIIHFKETKHVLFAAIPLTAILMLFSVVFSPQLQALGFYARAEITDMATYGLNRNAGFFTGGDVNSTGAYFAITVGFILLLNHFQLIKGKFSYFLIGVGMAGVLATLSRAAFISLILVFGVYIVFNSYKAITYYRIIAIAGLAMVVFSITPAYELLMQRFSSVTYGEGILDPSNTGGRLGGYLHYLSFIFSNPDVLLSGYSNPIYSHFYGYERGAHNFYIMMVYNVGIIPFIFLIYLYFRSFVIIRNNINAFAFLILFVPMIFFTQTVHDAGIFRLFILYFSTLSILFIKNSTFGEVNSDLTFR